MQLPKQAVWIFLSSCSGQVAPGFWVKMLLILWLGQSSRQDGSIKSPGTLGLKITNFD